MLYDFETRLQWVRERHAVLLAEAEIERELARSANRPSLRAQAAAFLRGLANCLDPETADGQLQPLLIQHTISVN